MDNNQLSDDELSSVAGGTCTLEYVMSMKGANCPKCGDKGTLNVTPIGYRRYKIYCICNDCNYEVTEFVPKRR